MSEKSLNYLILIFFLITIGGAFVVSGNLIENEIAKKYIRYAYVIPFGITPLLLIAKIVSRLFLGALKGRPLSSIECWFAIYYLLLTKEARKEWIDYIEEEKRKSV